MSEIDWQARAVAAEVAINEWVDLANDCDTTTVESLRQSMRFLCLRTPDLTAARELVRKAGEADGLFADVAQWHARADLLTIENAALALIVGELRMHCRMMAVTVESVSFSASITVKDADRLTWVATRARDAEALPLPEAVKRAALQRDFCDAALALDGARSASIDHFADLYRSALAALRAARGKS